MKYSNKFEKDFKWYQSVRYRFNFDGALNHTNKRGEPIVKHSETGVSAKKAFYLYDSQGIITPTYEPIELKSVLITKGSVNLHIKMYAQDRAKGYLPKIEFDEICKQLKCPQWFIDAVERQKAKYY